MLSVETRKSLMGQGGTQKRTIIVQSVRSTYAEKTALKSITLGIVSRQLAHQSSTQLKFGLYVHICVVSDPTRH